MSNGSELSPGAVIVTGAGGGIGRAVVRGIVDRGQPVVLVGRDASTLDATRASLGEDAAVLTAPGDVRDERTLEVVAATAVERFGRIGALVACAAVKGPETAFEDTLLAEFDETFAVNVMGLIAACRAVLPSMREHAAGNIVLFSSGAGHAIPRPAVRSLAYQLSKFAVEGLVDGLAVELRGTGINVNGFRPGRTLAGANVGRGLAGLRQPEQAVEPVLFLASLAPSEMSGYILEATEFERGFRPVRRDHTTT